MADVIRCSPQDWINQAAELLRDVWDPPALEYSPEYLRWQFTQPSNLQPICLVIAERGELDCFVAAIGQRERLDGQIREVYFTSHFAARRGGHAMNAFHLLRAEGRAISEAGAPVVAFAAPASAGENLLRLLAVDGLSGRRMGLLPGYMVFASKTSDAAVRVSCEQWAAAVAEMPAPARTIEPALDVEALRHYETHPWTREFVVAANRGRVTAAGIAGTIRSVSRSETQITATLNAIRALDAEGLEQLILYTARRFGAKVVNLPVVAHLGPEMLRAVGARRTRSEFAWSLFTKPGAPVASAEHVAVEIV